MKLKQLGSNQTVIETNNGTIVLFSYNTPVAACLELRDGRCDFIRTSRKWSKTTTKHINAWLAGAKAVEVDQSVLDGLV